MGQERATHASKASGMCLSFSCSRGNLTSLAIGHDMTDLSDSCVSRRLLFGDGMEIFE